MRIRYRAVPVVVVGTALAACTAEAPSAERTPSTPAPASSPAVSSPATAGPCVTPPAAADGAVDVPATGGHVAALVLVPQQPLRVGSPLKVVWRVTGEGDLQVSPRRPDGSTGRLSFGPEPHQGSNFDRPGDEWGTGVVLDAAGCWQLRVQRGAVSGTLPVQVLPAA